MVGVIDTGIDYSHSDLASNMWVNSSEVPGDGIDNDGNGFVDDVHGINAITNTGDPMDDEGHGTHVSGTIGASGNNATGVVGVNHEVSMVGCKFLDAAGNGSTSDAIKCIDYMVGLKNAGVNLRVLNNSWGGGGYSQALADASTVCWVEATGMDPDGIIGELRTSADRSRGLLPFTSYALDRTAESEPSAATRNRTSVVAAGAAIGLLVGLLLTVLSYQESAG